MFEDMHAKIGRPRSTASLESSKRKDELVDEKPPADDAKNPSVDWHGEPRGHETHEHE